MNFKKKYLLIIVAGGSI